MASRQCSLVDVARPVGVASHHGRFCKSEEEKELGMPRYEFLCEKCQKPFELTMTITEREKAKPTCPTCKGTEIVPQVSGFMAQTKKKS